MGQFASVYSTEVVLRSTGVGATHAVGFGFVAQTVRIRNAGAVPVQVNLGSTAAASTGDPDLEAGGLMQVSGLRISGLGVGTTSTTSSTGLDGHRVTIAAWGGY